MPKRKEAQSRAHQVVEAEIQQCIEKHNPLLPSCAALARKAGVARMTMWKVLLSFAQHSRIVSLGQRRGYRIASLSPYRQPAVAPQIQKNAAHSVEQSILQDIIDGRYPPDYPLPPYKVLQSTYGASHTVIQVALQKLLSKRLIRRHKRSYCVLREKVDRSKNVLTVIASTTDSNVLTAPSCRGDQFWRCLEEEVALRNIGIVFISLHEDGSFRSEWGKSYHSFTEIEQDFGVLGHLVLPVHIDNSLWDHLLSTLRLCKVPLVVLDEIAGGPFSKRLHQRPNTLCFSLGFGTLPGYIVGKYLISGGHRKVRFLSVYSSDPASRARFAGVCKAFDDYTLSQKPELISILDKPHHTDEHENPFWHVQGHQHLMNAFSTADKIMESPPQLSDEQVIQKRIQRSLYEKKAQNLFKNALTNSESTAWIAMHDELALMALQYLKNHNIAVPRNISVVGFDDIQQALPAGLTSYNFNMRGLVNSTLHFLLYGRIIGARSTSVGLEIPGHVISRFSSKRLLP